MDSSLSQAIETAVEKAVCLVRVPCPRGRPRRKGPPKGKHVLVCSVCGYATSHSTGMQNHLIIHTGLRPYKCDYCGKAFNQKCNMVTHMRIHSCE
ncbi:hypothetical protein HPB51_012742 [Rhipicephalus microplus]|uniref:C2H2-type domain-containing protein n=1 Tax=Rhipicephalus microplus TaxID=6941 RepID=A0A9J6E9P6_RHIMP|nr:hypothetical protein HPB51_012742 [Rhipicephalus microplus]